MIPIDDVVYYVRVTGSCIECSSVRTCSAWCTKVASRRLHKRVIPAKVVSDLDEAQP